MKKLIAVLTLPWLLSACATQNNAQPQAVAGPDANTTNARVGRAITSPLNDLNLVHTAIPPVLNEAMKDPYRAPPEKTCASLTEQIRALDAVLGPDLDAPADPEQSLSDKGKDTLGDAAIGAVTRTAEGAVPFRSWIRKLTGAEQRSKDLQAAIAAGVVHRAYLKGMGQSLGCAAPAAPLPRAPAAAVVAPAVDNKNR